MGRLTKFLSGGAVLTAVVVGGWSSQASAHVTIDTLGPVTSRLIRQDRFQRAQ